MSPWSVEWLILVYFTIVVGWNYLLMFAAQRQIKRQNNIPEPKEWPDITILVPAYNEELVIIDSVSQMLEVSYPGRLNVAICDDGSTDDTFGLLAREYDLEAIEPNVFTSADGRVKVIRQENKGRAGGLNGALSIADGTYVCQTDADTILDRNGLTKIVKVMENDEKLQAVGGTIVLANGIRRENGTVVGRVPRNILAGMQAIEYLRAFLYGRLGLNRLGGNVIISGAFGVFRRETVERLGGWNEKCVAEDFDMTVRIRKDGGKSLFIPDPVAWTEAPEKVRDLGAQRERWHRGLSQVIFDEGKKVAFRSKYGALAYIIPIFFVVEWLAPIVEVIGLSFYGLHIVFFNLGLLTAGGIFLLAWLLNTGLSLIAIWMEQTTYRRYRGLGDTQKLILYSLTEIFWYRPLTVIWRIKGLINYLLKRNHWGRMTRKGFSKNGLMKLVLPLAVGSTFLLTKPEPLQSQTWVESEYAVESGEVKTRTDIAVRLAYKPILTGVLYRERDGVKDQFGFLNGNVRLGNIQLEAGIGAASTQDIFPEYEINWSIGLILGHFVNTFGIQYQGFRDTDFETLVMYRNTLEYYIGNWRLAGSAMVGSPNDGLGIWAGKASINRYGRRLDWGFYGSVGNELLDVPRIVGAVKEIGVTNRWKIAGPFELGSALGTGERENRNYFFVTTGLRINF